MSSIPLSILKLSADGKVAPASSASVSKPKPPAPPKPPEPPKPPGVQAPYSQPASPTEPNMVPTEDKPKEVLPPDEEWVWSPETEKEDGSGKGAWIRMKKSSLPL